MIEYFKPKEPKLFAALRTAIENMIKTAKKISNNFPTPTSEPTNKSEHPKNILPRFTFEDTTLEGQLKKLVELKMTDELTTDEMRIQQFNTKYDTIAASIRSNIEKMFNPMKGGPSATTGKPSAVTKDPTQSTDTATPDKDTTPDKEINQLSKSKDNSSKKSNANINASVEESITEVYEDLSGDNEYVEPDGVPVLTSKNLKTGLPYSDYPEVAFAGNFFSYEFEDQTTNYESGPWFFKEKMSVPAKPEKIVRTLQLSSDKNTISIMDPETNAYVNILNAGVQDEKNMKQYYYQYFNTGDGTGGIIDTKDEDNQYDPEMRYIQRMKLAMYELINRRAKSSVAPIPSSDAQKSDTSKPEGEEQEGETQAIQEPQPESSKSVASTDIDLADIGKQIQQKITAYLANAKEDIDSILQKAVSHALENELKTKDLDAQLTTQVTQTLQNEFNSNLATSVAEVLKTSEFEQTLSNAISNKLAEELAAKS
jgi:hypothetical protein